MDKTGGGENLLQTRWNGGRTSMSRLMCRTGVLGEDVLNLGFELGVESSAGNRPVEDFLFLIL